MSKHTHSWSDLLTGRQKKDSAVISQIESEKRKDRNHDGAAPRNYINHGQEKRPSTGKRKD